MKRQSQSGLEMWSCGSDHQPDVLLDIGAVQEGENVRLEVLSVVTERLAGQIGKAGESVLVLSKLMPMPVAAEQV